MKAKRDEEFLQHFGMLARTGASIDESAEALGMTGKELEGLFRKRPNVLRTWRSARLNLILGIRGAMAKSAAEGKLPAIERLLEELEKVEIIPQPAPAIDFEHLKTSELMIAIGKTRNTIDRWRNESGLKRAADKTYSLPDFIDWFERYCRSKYATTSVSGDPLRDARAEKSGWKLTKSGRCCSTDRMWSSSKYSGYRT